MLAAARDAGGVSVGCGAVRTPYPARTAVRRWGRPGAWVAVAADGRMILALGSRLADVAQEVEALGARDVVIFQVPERDDEPGVAR